MAEYLYLACIPPSTSTIILIYLICILAGLHDCMGEEAIGYIDDNAHTSNNTDGSIVRLVSIVSEKLPKPILQTLFHNHGTYFLYSE